VTHLILVTEPNSKRSCEVSSQGKNLFFCRSSNLFRVQHPEMLFLIPLAWIPRTLYYFLLQLIYQESNLPYKVKLTYESKTTIRRTACSLPLDGEKRDPVLQIVTLEIRQFTFVRQYWSTLSISGQALGATKSTPVPILQYESKIPTHYS